MDFLTPLKVKEYSGQPVTIAQVKFDGYYVEIYKSKEFGICVCTKGRKVNIWSKLQRNSNIKVQLESLPDETILRCELHAFNVHATSIPTLINEADERLIISPFCIEKWNGDISDISFEEEFKLLFKHGFIVPKIERLFSTPNCLTDKAVIKLKNLAGSLKLEGWVLKDCPRGDCYKIKPQKTVDAFVVDYTISDSDTYAGGLKSVDIAVWGDGLKKNIIIATVGTGFDGEYRMSVDMKSLIGRVGEFKYQSIGAKGRLIFPRFLRWRYDEKSKHECGIDQLKGV